MAKQRNLLLELAVDGIAQGIPGSDRISTDPQVIAEVAVARYQANQKPLELAQLLRKARNIVPETIVEIGTARGGSLFAFSQIAHSNALLISIDKPEGPGGGGYRLQDELRFARRLVKGQTQHYIRANSHDDGDGSYSTYSRVQRLLSTRSIDLLFIDGDHSYKGVKHDFERYGRLVRAGGIIALHDIVPNPHDASIGVPDFWQNLKDRNHAHTEEFRDIRPSNNLPADAGGIGVFIPHFNAVVPI